MDGRNSLSSFRTLFYHPEIQLLKKNETKRTIGMKMRFLSPVDVKLRKEDNYVRASRQNNFLIFHRVITGSSVELPVLIREQMQKKLSREKSSV